MKEQIGNERIRNKVFCGDCLEMLTTMPDDCVDLVFYDPPYNIGKQYDNYDDDMPQEQYIAWQTRIATESRRVSKRGVVVYISQDLRKRFEQIFPLAKLVVVSKRAAGTLHTLGFAIQWYCILAEAQCVERTRDLWDDCRLPGEGYYFRENRTGNPGQTSIAVIEKVLTSFTLKGDIVYDPFMGCGSTAIAAIHTGRHYFGTELSPTYCNVANEAIRREHAQLSLFNF